MVIDETNTYRAFTKELRWNQAYHRMGSGFWAPQRRVFRHSRRVRPSAEAPQREGPCSTDAKEFIVPDPLTFPNDFLRGAATAAHQVEGDNRTSDWWEWETDRFSKVSLAEPSGSACDHFHRYRDDIALLARLGLNAYRFSVEWARVEPRAGEFDEAALMHYSDMVAACVQSGVTPIVTLQHLTLPAWVAHAGSWLNPDMPDYFARYTRKVVERLGDLVRYFCTINEPGNLLTRGYLGTFPSPPFIRDLTAFDTAAAAVNAAHRRSRDVIKELFPSARVGMAHALQDWHANAGGTALMAFGPRAIRGPVFRRGRLGRLHRRADLHPGRGRCTQGRRTADSSHVAQPAADRGCAASVTAQLSASRRTRRR